MIDVPAPLVWTPQRSSNICHGENFSLSLTRHNEVSLGSKYPCCWWSTLILGEWTQLDSLNAWICHNKLHQFSTFWVFSATSLGVNSFASAGKLVKDYNTYFWTNYIWSFSLQSHQSPTYICDQTTNDLANICDFYKVLKIIRKQVSSYGHDT